LGLFAEFKLGLIRIEDALKSLLKFKLDRKILHNKKFLLESAIFLREPILADYFSLQKNWLTNAFLYSSKAVPTLVGEIFTEEDRMITGIYEGILRAVAIGKVSSGEISSYLFSRKLLEKDDPSLIQQYLVNLVQFGMLKKLEFMGKRDKSISTYHLSSEHTTMRMKSTIFRKGR
jgi:hypothetical protein